MRRYAVDHARQRRRRRERPPRLLLCQGHRQGLTLGHFSAQLERCSAVCEIRGARRGCVARVKGVLGGV